MASLEPAAPTTRLVDALQVRGTAFALLCQPRPAQLQLRLFPSHHLISPHLTSSSSLTLRPTCLSQAADINRQSLALEVRAQLDNLGALPSIAMIQQLTDLVEKRGTVRSFCKAVQCQCDEQGIPVLERTAHALLNEQVPASIATAADEARAQQRTAQRRRASGEELEDDSRFSR